MTATDCPPLPVRITKSLLGYGVTVFALVGLSSQAEHDLTWVRRSLGN